MGALFLAVAILTEVGGTLALRAAVSGRKLWYAAVGAGYLLSFAALTFALAAGMPLGVGYGIWAAAGVALTAVLSRVLFQEPLTWVMGLGIVAIAAGVLLIEMGSAA